MACHPRLHSGMDCRTPSGSESAAHGIDCSLWCTRYAGLVVSGRMVSFTVANVGSYDGDEVAQLYIGFPAGAGEPPQSLKVVRATRRS